MNLSEIFSSEELTASGKILHITEVVTRARTAYGNSDHDITAPEMHTADGLQDLAMLSAESKLVIAESEVRNIKVIANEFAKSFEGAKLDKKIEELIAISPILANIATTVDSEYI